MGKRNYSSSDSEENVSNKELLKRLYKLEKKLKKVKRRARSRSRDLSRCSSRQRSPSIHRKKPADDRRRSCVRSPNSIVRATTPIDGRSPSDSESNAVSPNGTGRTPRGSEVPLNMFSRRGCSPSETERPHSDDCLIINNDENLPDKVLGILGSNPENVPQKQTALHESIKARWGHIMCHGLSDENLQEVKAKIALPSNLGLVPPAVNPEILPILTKQMQTRDNSHANYQTQLGLGLAELGRGLNIILGNGENIPPDLQELLTHFWDAGRILTHLFCNISQVRRQLILPSLNKNVKDMAEKTQPTADLLFGPNLADMVKSAKQFKAAGKEIKAPPVYKVMKHFYQKKGGERTNTPQTQASTSSSQHLNRYRPVRRPMRDSVRKSKPFQGQSSHQDKYPRKRY